MDADGEFEQIYEYIDGFAKCNGIQEIDSSTINFRSEIDGVKVDLKKLNVYEVDMFQEGCMISDEMDYDSFSAIAYVFKYKSGKKTGIYYIDCKNVQCDKYKFGLHSHTKFRPILSTAFDVHLLDGYINHMYKYGYGHKKDKTSLYTTFSRDITKYTSKYHSYEHCFNRRGWTYMKKVYEYLRKEDEPWDYIDYRYEDDDFSDSCSDSCSDNDSE